MPPNCEVCSPIQGLEECSFMHDVYLEVLDHFLEAVRLFFPFLQFFRAIEHPHTLPGKHQILTTSAPHTLGNKWDPLCKSRLVPSLLHPEVPFYFFA